MRGVPERIRSDSGPDFTAKVACDWLKRMGVEILFIEPGPPLDNDYVENFNGRLADELPERDLFCTLLAAKVLIERWRCCYDAARPHNSAAPRARGDCDMVSGFWSYTPAPAAMFGQDQMRT